MHQEIAALQERLAGEHYVADRAIATALYLAMRLHKPLLIEGEAGVGKTEVAKVLARVLGTNLIRLQCYEGLDVATALYEWNYPKQMLRIKMEEGQGRSAAEQEQLIFSEPYLLKRPLLQAIMQPDQAPVLLIDEVDRADEEFEAFCLEVLSDFQVTVPELGTITARHRPYVVLTSNRTRTLSDALRRRCLYLWIDYPSFAKEVQIIETRVPGAGAALARQIAALMQVLRRARLNKTPGVAESLDWAAVLVALHCRRLAAEVLADTLGAVLKDPEDLSRVGRQWLAVIAAELPQGADAPDIAAWASALADRLTGAPPLER